mgnify:CR=1 FL=1
MVQNAQRSRAKNLWVHLAKSHVTIKDDGKGCSNPDNLFVIASSSWRGLESENPFGTGFYSLLTAAKEVHVRSATWSGKMNLQDIFERESLDVLDIRQGMSFVPGFEVILLQPELSPEDIAQEFEKECKYVDFTLWINGEEHSPVSFLQQDAIVFEDDEIEGWIEPEIYGYVKTFHKRRFVEELMHHAQGRVEFKKAHPRCPDRTAWLCDIEKSRAIANLRNRIKAVYLAMWKQNKPDEIDRFSTAILYCDHAALLSEHVFVEFNVVGTRNIFKEQLVAGTMYHPHDGTRDALDRAQHFHVPVVVSRNSVEDALLSELGLEATKELDKKLTIRTEVIPAASNSLQPILNALSYAAGLPLNSIRVGQLKYWTTYNGVEKELVICGLAKDNVAWLQKNALRSTNKETILTNLVTIAHEAAHLFGFDDGEKAHVEKQLALIELWGPALTKL